jgi:hypothetical protein
LKTENERKKSERENVVVVNRGGGELTPRENRESKESLGPFWGYLWGFSRPVC